MSTNKGGRPALSPEDRRTNLITVRLTGPELRRLESIMRGSNYETPARTLVHLVDIYSDEQIGIVHAANRVRTSLAMLEQAVRRATPAPTAVPDAFPRSTGKGT